MEKKMKVAVMRTVNDIVFEERDIPTPKPNEILVKIKHVGICGSDMHYYEHGRIGDFVVEEPMILGHESAGEIVELGSEVTDLEVGDLVALEPGYTCGKCEFCKTGKYNLCPDVVFMATPPYDGAFSEYVAYPADMAFKLPEGMSTLEGALLEPLSVGLHAAIQGNAKIGQSAVILGSGCIGLVTLMSLKAMGVTEVYVSDLIQNRLDLAKEFGATEVFKVGQDDITKCVMDLTDGKGVDLVFETAGNVNSTKQTTSLVKRGGTIVLVGMSPDGHILYDIGTLMAKEARIETVFRYRNLYPTAIKAVASGLIPLKKVATDFFKFDDVINAMDYVIKNKAVVIKGVIEF